MPALGDEAVPIAEPHPERAGWTHAHPLRLVTGVIGACDVCGRNVNSGERVLDCRPCNFYACTKCAEKRQISAPFEVTVREFTGKRHEHIRLSPEDTVLGFKAKVQQLTGTDPDRQRLLVEGGDGKPLDDGKAELHPLACPGLADGALVHMTVQDATTAARRRKERQGQAERQWEETNAELIRAEATREGRMLGFMLVVAAGMGAGSVAPAGAVGPGVVCILLAIATVRPLAQARHHFGRSACAGRCAVWSFLPPSPDRHCHAAT